MSTPKWEVWIYRPRAELLGTFDSQRKAREAAREFARANGTTVRRSTAVFRVTQELE